MNDDVKVLIVEDEPILRELYVAILKDMECNGCDHANVDDVGSFEDALPLLEANAYDLVLTDFRLPGKNGIELIRKVSKCYSQTPCLLISGLVDANLTRQALEAGAISCLKKPCSIDDLLSVCCETIESHAGIGAGESVPRPDPSKHIAEILEANFINSIFVDGEFTIKMTSSAFENEYGDKVSKHCHWVIGGSKEPCSECQAMAAISSGTSKTIVREGRTPEGERWKIEERVEPWFDDAEACVGLLVSFTPLVSAFRKEGVRNIHGHKNVWDNKYKQTAPFGCVPKAEAVASFSEIIARALRNPDCNIPALCEILKDIVNRCDRPPAMKADIAAVVQPVLSRISFYIEAHNAKVETSLDAHLPMAYYSPPRLEQALLNVLWVALDRAPKGEELLYSIHSRQVDDMVELAVCGNLPEESEWMKYSGELRLDHNVPIRLIYASQLVMSDGGALEIETHPNGKSQCGFSATFRLPVK